MAQDNSQQVGQQGFDLGTQMAPLANPIMAGVDKISPIVEYLLQMIQGKQTQPAPSTTSQQTGPYRGPTANGLRGNMMGQPARDPNAMY